MIYKKTEYFENVLISIEDLKRIDGLFDKILADKFSEICSDDKSYKPKPALIKTISFNGRNSISIKNENESSDIADIYDLSELNLKKTESIEFDYNFSSKNWTSVSLKLVENSSYLSGAILDIETDDEEFLYKTVNNMQSIFCACKPVGKLYHKYKTLFYVFVWMLITVLLANSYIFFKTIFNVLGIKPENSHLLLHNHILIYALCYSLFAIGAVFQMPLAITYIEKIFPKLEFDFGPQHLRPRLMVRKRIVITISVIIIPYIIGILVNYTS